MANSSLKWQNDMGADEAIDDFTTNQKQLPKKPTKKANKPIKTVDSPANSSKNAQNLVENCQNLADLRSLVENFDGCAIKKTATNTVFCDGNPDSKIMIIGEAPGADEDIQGIPFCGASGKMLDQMLSFIGLSRKENFYITNTLFWRPPGNRRPTPEELEICKPFVEKHISLLNPELIILVGGTAVSAILNTNTGITKLRGQMFDYSNPYLDKNIPTTPIFHPSYLLRSPGQKRLAWQDLLEIRVYLEEKGLIKEK